MFLEQILVTNLCLLVCPQFFTYRFTAAIAEMLLQSTHGDADLYLLPALPREKWPKGYVKGLRARGNVTVNISWEKGELQEATVWSSNPKCTLRLHYGEQVAMVTVLGGNVYRFNGGLQCVETYMAP